MGLATSQIKKYHKLFAQLPLHIYRVSDGNSRVLTSINRTAMYDSSVIEKFNSKWKYSPSCWLWAKGKNTHGYGQTRTNGKHISSHRLSYEIHIGPIPDGLHVLHKCDVRACVNPDHLFLGTNADNMADKERKGRGNHVSPKGEESGVAKLTKAQVIEIRALIEAREATLTCPQIAKLYGITNQNVHAIKIRRTWSHI